MCVTNVTAHHTSRNNNLRKAGQCTVKLSHCYHKVLDLLDTMKKSLKSMSFSHDMSQTLDVTNSSRLTVTAGPRESQSPAGLTQIPDGSSPLGVQCTVQLYSYGYFCTITLTLTLYCPIILLLCQISNILLLLHFHISTI